MCRNHHDLLETAVIESLSLRQYLSQADVEDIWNQAAPLIRNPIAQAGKCCSIRSVWLLLWARPRRSISGVDPE